MPPGHLQAVGGAREAGPGARQGDQEDVGGGHLRVGREGERALRGHGEAQGRFVGLYLMLLGCENASFLCSTLTSNLV